MTEIIKTRNLHQDLQTYLEEWVVNVWSIHATPSRNLTKTSQLHFTPRTLKFNFMIFAS